MRPPASCAACGEPVPDPAARFCENCGASLAVAALSAVPAGPPAAGCEESIDAALAMASDRGRRHPLNQDAGAVARRPDGAVLLCVADGVSSADNAEGASAAAVAAALERFAAGPGNTVSVSGEARACVEAAARAVLDVPRLGEDPDLDPPETTIALAVVRDGVAGLAWVGDSRAYRVDGAADTLLTRDDSWAWDAVARGTMSREAAARDPRAHAITQCLGMPPDDIEVHASTAALPAGAALLLCTDGLWNYHDAAGGLGEAYADAAGGGADAALACRRLVAEANGMGGRDNITVALLKT
ncbi:serine/threonine protein phosphatase [Lichenibacterium minor]|uniref:Serine/threonine protein phosphatase n=1 Tax=Lichenibacterium minor TaxID=2316528 RepID=A0A4Q2UCP4_9HYPH|nr:protein phosphatase 2C domain-containing protein [Lichenibacterium minor]RYC33868.1 serine/threonine protein phosphatase [Lichenibacterium minor]